LLEVFVECPLALAIGLVEYLLGLATGLVEYLLGLATGLVEYLLGRFFVEYLDTVDETVLVVYLLGLGPCVLALGVVDAEDTGLLEVLTGTETDLLLAFDTLLETDGLYLLGLWTGLLTDVTMGVELTAVDFVLSEYTGGGRIVVEAWFLYEVGRGSDDLLTAALRFSGRAAAAAPNRANKMIDERIVSATSTRNKCQTISR
jgi:hypothetical protein